MLLADAKRDGGAPRPVTRRARSAAPAALSCPAPRQGAGLLVSASLGPTPEHGRWASVQRGGQHARRASAASCCVRRGRPRGALLRVPAALQRAAPRARAGLARMGGRAVRRGRCGRRAARLWALRCARLAPGTPPDGRASARPALLTGRARHAGPPWPHVAVLLLLLLGVRSHSLLTVLALALACVLAALHARGLRCAQRRPPLALMARARRAEGVAAQGHDARRHRRAPGLCGHPARRARRGPGARRAPLPRHLRASRARGPCVSRRRARAGVLLAASDDLERSIFRRSVVLLFRHSQRGGARGVILSQALVRARAAPAGAHPPRQQRRR